MPTDADKPKGLRDEFALAAIPAFIPSHVGANPTPDNFANAAECAYKVADAMLAERNKPTP